MLENVKCSVTDWFDDTFKFKSDINRITGEIEKDKKLYKEQCTLLASTVINLSVERMQILSKIAEYIELNVEDGDLKDFCVTKIQASLASILKDIDELTEGQFSKTLSTSGSLLFSVGLGASFTTLRFISTMCRVSATYTASGTTLSGGALFTTTLAELGGGAVASGGSGMLGGLLSLGMTFAGGSAVMLAGVTVHKFMSNHSNYQKLMTHHDEVSSYISNIKVKREYIRGYRASILDVLTEALTALESVEPNDPNQHTLFKNIVMSINVVGAVSPSIYVKTM